MNGNNSCYGGFCAALSELMAQRGDLVVVESRKHAGEGDVSAVCGTRYVRTTVAEQDAVLTASGLALCGNRVFLLAPQSPLLPARAYEQIRSAVAVPNLKVMILSIQDSDAFNQDGAARQMSEDFALMRVLPNMTVLAPSDRNSAYALTKVLSHHNGPVYMRLGSADAAMIYEDDDADFGVGGARLLKEGDGVTICANGSLVKEAMKAATILAQQGINAEIIDYYSIKPFSEQTLLASVRRTGCCVVAEHHNTIGGLYGAVAETLGKSYTVPLRSVALEDEFGQSGTAEELQEYYGLTYREIVHNVVQAWAMRRR